MRTFGACLAIMGVILGMVIGVFGWLMLIVGLLVMIAAPKKIVVEQAGSVSRQSTGGYAGLAKNASPRPLPGGKRLGQGPGKSTTKGDDPWERRKHTEK